MESSQSPQFEIAEQVLPRPLLQGLQHVFAQGIQGCVLAGGTALAGFYAGHRRSDDLDLFTATEFDQRAAVLAVKSLSSTGASLKILVETQQYFEATATSGGHIFKITVVLDKNLFRVGRVVKLKGNIQVVDLSTLLKMKAATLVSRCSEKDLYDLIWLFEHFSKLTVPDLIRLGNEIDGGMDAEAVLLSVEGAILNKTACGFAVDPLLTSEKIYKKILDFRKQLIQAILNYIKAQPTPALGALVQALRKLK